MARAKVIVSPAAIQAVEKKIAGHDRQIAKHQRERERLVATRDAMRTILGPSANGHRPAARLIEKPRSGVVPASNAEMTLPQAFLVAMEKSGGSGLTPRQIREAVLKLGIRPEQMGVTGSYLYSVIARALKRGQVVSRGGRYHMAPKTAMTEADTKS